MTVRSRYDAIVIGAGPNGLAAAIRLAQSGRSVLLVEARSSPGGGAASAELTLPGFVHDICSAVHPLALASPFFRRLPLEKHGLRWIQPTIPLAHPLADGRVACLHQSLELTSETLGRDGPTYQRWMARWIARSAELFDELLAPLHFFRPSSLGALWDLARFGFWAIRSTSSVVHRLFVDEPARCLFGGLAAHSFLPLTQAPSAAIGLVLGIAGHAVGWPIPEGGAQRISDALAAYLRSLGGELLLGHPVQDVRELPESKVLLFDLAPREALRIAGDRFPERYRRRLQHFRHGPAAFKLDWALSGPIPWSAPECRQAGTLHLAASFEELVHSEQAPWNGATVERPFVLLSQPSLFDPTRAPGSGHTAWAYCHVPQGSTVDMSEAIESQIERFAPGFKERILARHVMAPADLERHNPNLVGGDISGGVTDFRQLFFRPAPRLVPYATPVRGWYFCSASTPPGAGVHGMCGFHAANAALSKRER